MPETFDGMVVRIEGDPQYGACRVWINGIDVTTWLYGEIKLSANYATKPNVTLTFAPDRLWYETKKQDNE